MKGLYDNEGAEVVGTFPSLSMSMGDLGELCRDVEMDEDLRMVLRLSNRISLLSKWFSILPMTDDDLDPTFLSLQFKQPSCTSCLMQRALLTPSTSSTD